MLITWVVLALLFVDQAVKLWAVHVLRPMVQIPLIPGVFGLHYTENQGAFFSLLDGMGVALTLVSFAASGFIIWLMTSRKYRFHGWPQWSLALILAGALGNLIDRALYGRVVDLFEFEFVKFAIFNVADICITIGGVLFVYVMLFTKPDHPWLKKT